LKSPLKFIYFIFYTLLAAPPLIIRVSVPFTNKSVETVLIAITPASALIDTLSTLTKPRASAVAAGIAAILVSVYPLAVAKIPLSALLIAAIAVSLAATRPSSAEIKAPFTEASPKGYQEEPSNTYS